MLFQNYLGYIATQQTLLKLLEYLIYNSEIDELKPSIRYKSVNEEIVY